MKSVRQVVLVGFERLAEKQCSREHLQVVKTELKVGFTNSLDPKMAWSLYELKGLAVDTNNEDDLYGFVDELEPGLSEKFKGPFVPHIPQPIAAAR